MKNLCFYLINNDFLFLSIILYLFFLSTFYFVIKTPGNNDNMTIVAADPAIIDVDMKPILTLDNEAAGFTIVTAAFIARSDISVAVRTACSIVVNLYSVQSQVIALNVTVDDELLTNVRLDGSPAHVRLYAAGSTC